MLGTGWGRMGTPEPAPTSSGEALQNLKVAEKGYAKDIGGLYGGALIPEIGGEYIPELLGRIPAISKAANWISEGAENTPFLAKYSRMVEGAKGPLEAAIKGGTGGALLGGLEGTWEGHPGQRALEGAGMGAALGAGLHTISRIATPEFRNIPFAGESEPPVTVEKAPPLIAGEPQVRVRSAVPRTAMGKLIPAIEEAAGTKPLARDIPLRGQMTRWPELPPAGKSLPEGVTISAPQEDTDEFLHPVKTIRAMKDGKEIGAISLSPEENGRFRVSSVSVEHPHGGQGIGEHLYRAAVKYAQDNGARGITSDWRFSTAPEAQRIWKRLGAVETVAPTGEPMFEVGAMGRPRAVGAGIPRVEQIAPRTGVVPRVPVGSRVAVPISEEFGPMMKAEGKIPRIVTEEPARQMGAGPLRPGVSLREQPKVVEAPVRSEQARLEEKYPDKGVRQMVHANGERLVDMIGDDPETMRSFHELSGPDLRQAAINDGIDMGQISVGNRKAVGNQIGRVELINKLLDRGLTPQKIVELARKPIE